MLHVMNVWRCLSFEHNSHTFSSRNSDYISKSCISLLLSLCKTTFLLIKFKIISRIVIQYAVERNDRKDIERHSNGVAILDACPARSLYNVETGCLHSPRLSLFFSLEWIFANMYVLKQYVLIHLIPISIITYNYKSVMLVFIYRIIYILKDVLSVFVSLHIFLCLFKYGA